MVGIILIIMGVIFIAAGIFAGGAISGIGSSVSGSGVDVSGITGGASSIFTIAFGGVGLLLVVFGSISLFRSRKASAMHQQIMATGMDAQGQVTYVDRNYRVLINNAPIYSIVEYTYQVGGMQYANRIDKVSTESVVRAGIQVGSTIPIKYLPEDPSKSTIAAG